MSTQRITIVNNSPRPNQRLAVALPPKRHRQIALQYLARDRTAHALLQHVRHRRDGHNLGRHQHLNLNIAPGRLLLLVLRHARVRAGVLLPLQLLDDQRAIVVSPLPSIRGQRLAICVMQVKQENTLLLLSFCAQDVMARTSFPVDLVNRIAGHRTFDGQVAPGHARDFRHLTYERHSVHVHFGTVRDSGGG